MRNVLLVGNPSAMSGEAGSHIERARRGLEEVGYAVTRIFTSAGDDRVEGIRAAIEEARPWAVLSAGGDGTFCDVGRAVLATEARPLMAILPLGTANDHARSFGIPTGARALASVERVLRAARTVRLDVGRARSLASDGTEVDALFFDSLGWGMQPEILAARNRALRRRSSRLLPRGVHAGRAGFMAAAVGQLVRTFVEPTPFDAEIRCDDVTLHYRGLTDLYINNTPVYAGDWIPDPSARADDGRMELVAIRGRAAWLASSVRDLNGSPLSASRLERLGLRARRPPSGSRFQFRLERPKRPEIKAQLDGEEWRSGNHLQVEVIPRALSVLVPAEFEPPWRSPPRPAPR